MKKFSKDKEVIWNTYVKSGNLKKALARGLVPEDKIASIMENIKGESYKAEYQSLKECVPSDVVTKINGAIRSAKYAEKNKILNLKVSEKTLTRIKHCAAALETDSFEEMFYYLTDDKYASDIEDKIHGSSAIQSMERPDGQKSEVWMLQELSGYPKRLYGHLFYFKNQPQIAKEARKSRLFITEKKASSLGKELGSRKANYGDLILATTKQKFTHFSSLMKTYRTI
jgi:predicted DNA binding CopG/RHH family protein